MRRAVTIATACLIAALGGTAQAGSTGVDYLPTTPTTTVETKGTTLRLTLPAGAQAGPMRGVGITSPKSYKYGTFAARLKTADCTNQKKAGVVTGVFTFANDGEDHDGDGMTDNDEIDIEFLCAQPEVVYLTIWTQYDETTGASVATSKTIDLSTRIKKLDSAKAFHTYGFDWQPDHITYFVYDQGSRITLWTYKGRNIPDTAAPFMQNVWHTANWDPVGFTAHASTTQPVSAYIRSTSVK